MPSESISKSSFLCPLSSCCLHHYQVSPQSVSSGGVGRSGLPSLPILRMSALNWSDQLMHSSLLFLYVSLCFCTFIRASIYASCIIPFMYPCTLLIYPCISAIFHSCVHELIYPCISAIFHSCVHELIYPCNSALFHPCIHALFYPSIHLLFHPPVIQVLFHPCITPWIHSSSLPNNFGKPRLPLLNDFLLS